MEQESKSEGCSYLAWRGGFCYRHREDRLTATEVMTEGVEVSVPALPPLDLLAIPPAETGPNESAELESSSLIVIYVMKHKTLMILCIRHFMHQIHLP